MKEGPPQRPLTFHFGPGVLHDFRAARDKELLVTNGWGVRPGLSARPPWPGPRLRSEDLSFRYADAFGKLPEAYQTLLRDILTGGQTLFVRSDEVEYSWGLFTTLLEKRPLVSSYPAGSWGPEEADALLARDGHRWLNM